MTYLTIYKIPPMKKYFKEKFVLKNHQVCHEFYFFVEITFFA